MRRPPAVGPHSKSVAYLESRKRKNGKTAHYAIWIDAGSGKRMSQIFEGKNDAQFLVNVLNAHKSDTDAALQSARQAYGGAYTVEQMIADHVGLLTTANGYTIERYEGYVRNHINGGLGQLDAAKVGYAEIVEWIQSMQAKNLAAKTIANVHGLIAAAFNTMVRQKKRADNPCKGVALPKDDHTEEIATYLTMDEWKRLSTFLKPPYLQLFMFLAHTGLRFSEATALFARDFTTDQFGITSFRVNRAWTRDKGKTPVLGRPKTKESRRTVLVNGTIYKQIEPLLAVSKKNGTHVFLNTRGDYIDHRAAWHVWDRAVAKAQDAGLTKRPRIHDLRHSNASWLLQAGLEMFKLQKHLGHKSITTTVDRYSHLLPQAHADTALAMERAFG